MDKLAITEAEFELNTENAEEAARLFIQRKPAGMSVITRKGSLSGKIYHRGRTLVLLLRQGRGKV